MRDRLLNVALYELGWLACVLGAARGVSAAGALVALALTGVHVLLARRRGDEARLCLLTGLLGMAADSAQTALGVLAFAPLGSPGWLAPLWIVVMWMEFATLFRFALGWLRGRYALAAVLGGVGGPLAYYGGVRLGAATLPAGLTVGLAALALEWAMATPALVWLAGRGADRPGAGAYRW
jgi:hypothetical protein